MRGSLPPIILTNAKKHQPCYRTFALHCSALPWPNYQPLHFYYSTLFGHETPETRTSAITNLRTPLPKLVRPPSFAPPHPRGKAAVPPDGTPKTSSASIGAGIYPWVYLYLRPCTESAPEPQIAMLPTAPAAD